MYSNSYLSNDPLTRKPLPERIPAEKAAPSWEWEINARTESGNRGWKQLLSYRHLLFRMVRKEFLINYQQTVLGPLWIFIQPLLTLLVYVVVFGKLIRVPTSPGVPPVIFYLCGIVLWNFFHESFLMISRTFRENIHVFSKVYFPRLIAPLSVLITQFLRFLIQLLLLALLILWFVLFEGYRPAPGPLLWMLPLTLLVCGLMSLATGLLFAVWTGKYRDLINIVEVGVRLLFFITPVVYPLSAIPPEMQGWMMLNPLTSIFETFRACLLGAGEPTFSGLAYPLLFLVMTLPFALHLFNRQGSRLIDIV